MTILHSSLHKYIHTRNTLHSSLHKYIHVVRAYNLKNQYMYIYTVVVKMFFMFSLLFFLGSASTRELQSRLKSKYRVERVKTPSKSGE